MEETDEGLQAITDYITEYKGKNLCNNCGTKLGLLRGKEIYYRFGLTKHLCKDCYKEYKQIIKNNKIKQKKS